MAKAVRTQHTHVAGTIVIVKNPTLRDYARALKFETAKKVLQLVFERHWRPGKKFPTSVLHRVAAKEGWPPLTDQDYALVLRALGFEQRRDGGRKDRRRLWRHPDPSATSESLVRDLPEVLQLIAGTFAVDGQRGGPSSLLRQLGDMRSQVAKLRSFSPQHVS